MRSLFVVLITFTISLQMSRGAALNPDIDKIETLKAKHVTYVYYGIGCPPIIDTYNLFGFKIECGGCNLDDDSIEKNKKVIEEIDKVYGKGWFDRNEYRFYEEFDKD